MNNKYIYGKFLFLGCDELIARALTPFMQFCSRSPRSLIDRICIDSSSSINNNTSYRCVEGDIGKNMSRFEGWKYSILYPHLNISFNPNIPSTITEDYIISRFESSRTTSSFKKEYFIITCSNTPEKVLDEVKNIIKNSNKNNYIHIHCEIGNPIDGGVIYCSNNLRNSENLIDYPKNIPNIAKGDTTSIDMTALAIMGANILFSILINILSFNIFRERPIYFNSSKMHIDDSPYTPEILEPIKLLGPKRGKKKKFLDDRFYILMIGAGAFGSNIADILLQISNNYPKKLGKFVMMDGDFVEDKNRRNQRFLPLDVGEFKVNPLIDKFSSVFPKLAPKLKAIPKYLYKLDEEFLLKAFEIDSIKDKNIIIIGGVDNIPTRREIHYGFCSINKAKNLIYIDSGNGSTERIGQTITGLKQYNNVILKPIASSDFDGGEILRNTEDIKVIGSCSRNIDEKPQDLTTTIAATCSASINFIHPFTKGIIKNNISLFDAENISMNSY